MGIKMITRKYIAKRISGTLIMMIALCLAGCGRKEDILFLPNETLAVEDPDNTNIADLLQRSAAGTMVQLHAGSLWGSGVIIHIDEKEMLVATAGHVLQGVEEVQVLFVDDTAADSSSITLSGTADVGFVRLDTNTIPTDTLNKLRYAATDKESYDALTSGNGIIVMGSVDGAAANAYEGVLLEPWIYSEDFSQYMMLGRTYAFPGMSGGGVFDINGHLIGILCGGDEENTIAILPLHILLAECEQGTVTCLEKD